MGFSFIGLSIAAVIFLPNLLFISFPPKNVPDGLKDAGTIYTILERVGQVGCIIILVISKTNYQNLNIDIWFFLMSFCVIVYYSFWIRYVIKGHDILLLFKPFLFIPIPMAIFPMCAFGFTALWGKSTYLGILTLLFSIGHFNNSWHSYNYIILIRKNVYYNESVNV